VARADSESIEGIGAPAAKMQLFRWDRQITRPVASNPAWIPSAFSTVTGRAFESALAHRVHLCFH
jgi:hypothetical protein